MKKYILSATVAFAMVFATSCGSETEATEDVMPAQTPTEMPAETEATHENHEGHNHGEEAQAGAFYCPMQCEGEKTYEAEGKCPVCGMDLVKKEA